MAQRYLFFNSVNDDRRIYQAQDFADYFGSVLSTGLLHEDNVPGLEVSVEAGTMNTVVDTGSAIMRGHLYINDAPHTLTHNIAEPTADRIDRIVLRLDLRNAHRNILLHVKEGVPNANPEPPELQRDAFIYELSLAQVRIRANTSTIDPSDVTDERLDDDVCGLVYSLLGNSYLQSQIDDIDSQLTQLANEFNESKKIAYASGAEQNINNNVVTHILFDNITTNDFAILENGQIKIIKQGIYQIILTANFTLNGNGFRQLIPHTSNYSVTQNAVIGALTRMQATSIVTVSDSEFILQLRVMQNSGSSLPLLEAYCQLRKIR